MAAREIIIPVRNSELGVAVSTDALPEDENDILQILQAEQAPLRLWLDFAKAYLQQGREEQTQRILEDGCSDGANVAALGFPASLTVCERPEIEHYYGNSKYDRLSLLCASASYYTRKVSLVRCATGRSVLTACLVQGRLEKDKKRRDECYEQANRYVWEARFPRLAFGARGDSARLAGKPSGQR